MALYYEAAAMLQASSDSSSLSARVYAAQDLKSKPAQLFALLSEAAVWSPVLSPVIEVAEVLKHERKLTPVLALLLTHDLLISKKGVACPKAHVLRLSIEKHKARLSSELTRARLRAGHPTLSEWREALAQRSTGEETLSKDRDESKARHARWVRTNTVRTTLDAELAGTFKDYRNASLEEVLSACASQKLYAQDRNIPLLLALPPGHELTRSEAYIQGHIILQDKASCFPAYLLNPEADDGDIIDACAAPGNKTTHLASLLVSKDPANLTNGNGTSRNHTIYAIERDKVRSYTLEQMVKKAGASNIVQCLAKQDFLRLKPEDDHFKNVSGLLLDPSCSGSGIIGRDDGDGDGMPRFVLPRTPAEMGAAKHAGGSKSKKRKRKGLDKPSDSSTSMTKPEAKATNATKQSAGGDADQDDEDAEPFHRPLAERLEGLSNFQLTLLKHAFAFPAARKIVYSTCSIHRAENEHVVVKALASDIAKKRGWRVERREEQVEGLRQWERRGDLEAVRGCWTEVLDEGEDVGVIGNAPDAEGISQACLRCQKGTAEGTMGFFAVKFVRDGEESGRDTTKDEVINGDGEEDDWEGFSDEGK